MGFFSELKNDLSQAVNEMVPDEEALDQVEVQAEDVAEDSAEAPETSEDISKMLDNMDFEAILEKEEQPASNSEPEWEEVETKKAEKTSRPALDENAVISAGMSVKGDIEAEGSLDLYGKVVGNINILGKLNVSGTIEGDSSAADIYCEKARITGEVVSRGTIKVGKNAIIIGNLSATSAVIAGAVKGDIDVKGPVILDTSAIVMGNIKSKSVQINNGAVIEGLCSQCYADVSPTSFFDEIKKARN